MEEIMRLDDPLISLAYQGGQMIREHYNPLGVPYWRKPDGMRVTHVDLAISRVYMARRSEFGDRVSVRGEEHSILILDAEIEFINDPLDATTDSTKGGVSATSMVAIMRQGILEASAICHPFSGRTMYAARCHGTFLCGPNGTAERFSVPPPRSRVIGVCPDYIGSYDMIAISQDLQGRGFEIWPIKGIGHAAQLVVLGEMIGLICPIVNVHDVAPPTLILRQAGCHVKDVDDQPLTFENNSVRGIIAARGEEYGYLRDAVQKHAT